jgi:hypothetical protein
MRYLSIGLSMDSISSLNFHPSSLAVILAAVSPISKARSPVMKVSSSEARDLLKKWSTEATPLRGALIELSSGVSIRFMEGVKDFV